MPSGVVMKPLLTLAGFLSFSAAVAACCAIAQKKNTQQRAASREVPVSLTLFNVGVPQIDTAQFFRTGRLGDSHFFVDAEDVAHGIANFAEGGVGLHRFVNVRHRIFRTSSGFAQRSEAARDFVVRAFRAKLAEPLGLALSG